MAVCQDEEELAGHYETVKRLSQAMPDGVIILDAEDHIVWANATAERYYSVDARRDAVSDA